MPNVTPKTHHKMKKSMYSEFGQSTNLENGQAKHTPGPWTIGDQIEENKYGVLERSINSEEIDEPVINLATVYGNDESAEANARLIAAAPDLLEALQSAWGFIAEGMQDNDEPDPLFDSLMDRIENAIQKATC